jgi:hypothetical protein
MRTLAVPTAARALVAAAPVGLWLFASFAVMQRVRAASSRIANSAAIDTAGAERVEISTHDGQRFARLTCAA